MYTVQTLNARWAVFKLNACTQPHHHMSAPTSAPFFSFSSLFLFSWTFLYFLLYLFSLLFFHTCSILQLGYFLCYYSHDPWKEKTPCNLIFSPHPYPPKKEGEMKILFVVFPATKNKAFSPWAIRLNLMYVIPFTFSSCWEETLANLPSTPEEFQQHFSEYRVSLMASSPPGQSVQKYFFYALQVLRKSLI